MTTSEFSNQFDVLYNNVMSNQAPGLDEYEKSVFLTKAQEDIVKAYFNPKGNKYFEGFDDSALRQTDFSMLMDTSEVTTFGTSIFDGRSQGVKSITLPSQAMIFVNEMLQVTRGTASLNLMVIPISYAEYTRQMSKPYKRPLQYQAWRLIDDASSSNNRSADLIAGSGDTLVKYKARFVKRPTPIILADLEGVTVGGLAVRTECELDPILHEDILQRAVELAKAAYTGDLNSQITLGNYSGTEKGIVPQSK